MMMPINEAIGSVALIGTMMFNSLVSMGLVEGPKVDPAVNNTEPTSMSETILEQASEIIEEDQEEAQQETSVEAVYSTDYTGYRNEYLASRGLSYENQDIFWKEAIASGLTSETDIKKYYCMMIALCEHESQFHNAVYYHNTNGSTDAGLLQVNSCNWGSLARLGIVSSRANAAQELTIPAIGIKAGFWYMNPIVTAKGICEGCYATYQTGKMSRNTSAASGDCWRMYKNWLSIIYPELL